MLWMSPGATMTGRATGRMYSPGADMTGAAFGARDTREGVRRSRPSAHAHTGRLVADEGDNQRRQHQLLVQTKALGALVLLEAHCYPKPQEMCEIDGEIELSSTGEAYALSSVI